MEKARDSSPTVRARQGAKKSSQRKVRSDTNTYIAIGILGGLVAFAVGLLILYPELPISLLKANDDDLARSINTSSLSFKVKNTTYFDNWTLEHAQKAAQNSFSETAKGLPPCASYSTQGTLLPDSYDLR